jgi:hypothetical protein
MDKLKRALQGRDGEIDEESGFVTQALDASTLSFGSRVKGFCISFGIGLVVAILGALTLVLGHNITAFSILYTIGNVTAIASTCFLMGPVKQFKNMFAPTRLIATIVMLVSLLLTLFSAFWWKKNGLALLFCIIQFCAFTWYGISYIPFARDAIIKCCNGIIG